MKAETTLKSKLKSSDHEQVMEYIHLSTHPLKDVMQAAREIILGANSGITEHIKWNAPSFCYEGEDRITFNLHSPAYVLLVFHRGAKVKDRHTGSPLFNDPTGLLQWITPDRANVKLTSLEDLNAKADRLGTVVKQWVAWAGE